AARHGPTRPALLLLAAVLHARDRDHGRREVTLRSVPSGAPVASEAFSLGVNYWPRRKAMGWWRDFDAAEVEDDLALISSLGMDVVRVFLLWDDWQPRPDQVSPRRLAELERVCDLAATFGLGLDVTFFVGHMSGPNWVPQWSLVAGPRGARSGSQPPRHGI